MVDHHEFLSQFGSTRKKVVSFGSSWKIDSLHLSISPLMHLRHTPKPERKEHHSPCTKLAKTLLPVCNSGCPTTICKKRCSPSLRCSITSSEKRFVKTLPGSGGMVTRADSRSRMSRKYSKSEYRRRTVLCLSLKAGMLVRQTIS